MDKVRRYDRTNGRTVVRNNLLQQSMIREYFLRQYSRYRFSVIAKLEINLELSNNIRMNTKLTLSINKEVIEAAKDYAKSQGRSLSNVIEEYLKSVTKREVKDEKYKFNPLIEELSGSLKLPEGKTYDDIRKEAMIKKHLK